MCDVYGNFTRRHCPAVRGAALDGEKLSTSVTSVQKARRPPPPAPCSSGFVPVQGIQRLIDVEGTPVLPPIQVQAADDAPSDNQLPGCNLIFSSRDLC
jgi:hypothetical protein